MSKKHVVVEPYNIAWKQDFQKVALRFYTPIYYLLQKYDMHPEQEEEAKRELISVVKEFCETYKG